MSPDQREEHLSHLATLWTVVEQAHQDEGSAAAPALRQLLEYYGPAIHRYFLGAVRNLDLADDLFQELALRLVRGDFRRADRSRGRFRDFLKTALYHLVIDAQRRQRRQALPLVEGLEPAAELSEVESDMQLVQAWRGELMARTWERLEGLDKDNNQHLYLVLRFRRDHPEVRSPAMAEQLSPILGKQVSAEWIRKRLLLARERFADLLLEEVVRSLEQPTEEELEQELIVLELFEYCKLALQRRRGR
jgi:RNA polymerase sigma-70 factor (ECF subfamily)